MYLRPGYVYPGWIRVEGPRTRIRYLYASHLGTKGYLHGTFQLSVRSSVAAPGASAPTGSDPQGLDKLDVPHTDEQVLRVVLQNEELVPIESCALSDRNPLNFVFSFACLRAPQHSTRDALCDGCIPRSLGDVAMGPRSDDSELM